MESEDTKDVYMAIAEKPLAHFMSGVAVDNIGQMMFTFASEFSIFLYERGGIFSRSRFIEKRHQALITFNILLPDLYFGMIPYDETQNHFSYDEMRMGHVIIDNETRCGWKRHSLGDLGAFEIVDSHQWEGVERVTINDSEGRVLDGGASMWDSASVDTGTGERILFMRSQNSKDEVFQANNALNMWVMWLRHFISPFRQDIDEINQDGKFNLSGIAGEDDAKFDEIYESIYLPVWRAACETLPESWAGNYTVSDWNFERKAFVPLNMERRRSE